MSDQKPNRLSFGQKRQIVCLLDEGVSHFVDRLDSFVRTYQVLYIPYIIFVIHICLIVVELEYIATSLYSLLSNTVFASFPVHLVGQKPPISTVRNKLVYHI